MKIELAPGELPIHDTEWLETLKAGDDVCVRDSGYSRHDAIRKVTRTTKTLVFIGDRKFRRDTGSISPRPDYRGADLHKPTHELRTQCRRLQVIRTLKIRVDCHLEGVTLEDLECALLLLGGKI